MRNCEKLSEFSGFARQVQKGFEDKDVVKNAWDGVATALRYAETGHYIVLKLVSNEFLFSCI